MYPKQMISLLQKQQKGEGDASTQGFQYDYYSQLESNAHSLFVLAMRSSQTKQKYFRDLDIFLILPTSPQKKRNRMRYVAIC
jgi:hypothetical protein